MQVYYLHLEVSDPLITGFVQHGFIPQPWVKAALQIPELRDDWVPLYFIVDTGSSVTAIHAEDSRTAFGLTDQSLDPRNWLASTRVGGVGGSVSYRVHDARLAFQHDDGHLDIIEGPIRIGGLESGNLPPVLGCDVLRHFEVRFRYGDAITLDR